MPAAGALERVTELREIGIAADETREPPRGEGLESRADLRRRDQLVRRDQLSRANGRLYGMETAANEFIALVKDTSLLLIIGMTLVEGAAFGVLGISAHIAIASTILVIVGFGVAYSSDVALPTFIQTRTPQHLLGRISSVIGLPRVVLEPISIALLGLILSHSVEWGFLAAGIAMFTGVLTFLLLKNKYVRTPEGMPIGGRPKKSDIPEGESESAKFTLPNIIISAVLLFAVTYGLHLVFEGPGVTWIKGWLYPFIFAAGISLGYLILSDKTITKIEKDRIWVLYVVCFFVMFFWGAFEQAGSSLTFIADNQTDTNILGWAMPPSMVQNFNSLFVIIFAIPFSVMWMWLSKCNAEPISPVKQSFGLALIALGYLIIAMQVRDLGTAGKIGVIWLVVLYLLHTWGELCLSPIGLSLVAKLAPRLLGPSVDDSVHALEERAARLSERTRLARELHDSVGHALSLVVVQAGAARKVRDTDPAFVDGALEAVEDAARTALTDLDQVLGYLNFSSGAPDPKFLGSLNRLWRPTKEKNGSEPTWRKIVKDLQHRLSRLTVVAPAFQDVTQATAVLQFISH